MRTVATAAAVGVALLATLSALADIPRGSSALALEVSPVPLDPTDPSRMAVGPLQYRGGLWLQGSDPRFGGLSDLRVSADGGQLTAISDCGHGFEARLTYGDDGHLTGVVDARLVPLVGPNGAPLGLADIDAESLVAAPAGDWEVGFEGRGRIQAYGPHFAGPAKPVPTPPGLGECGRNEGLEAMADVGDGQRLLVCEGRRSASRTVPAWVGHGAAWTERDYPLLFAGGWAGEPFRPTAAARLPGGDVLVLERRFPPVGARLVRITRQDLQGKGSLDPQEVARFEAPLTLDNFEGVDVRRDARGRTLVYLLSDDNNCDKGPGSRGTGQQRTLLLLFELEG
jgi:hypothetical protein